MTETEIKQQLNAAIDRTTLSGDRERMERFAVNLLVPVVKRLMEQAVREAKLNLKPKEQYESN